MMRFEKEDAYYMLGLTTGLIAERYLHLSTTDLIFVVIGIILWIVFFNWTKDVLERRWKY